MEVKGGRRCVETIKLKRLDSTYISLLRNFIRRLYIIKRGWGRSDCYLPFFFFFTPILFSTKWTVFLSLEFRDDDSVIKKKKLVVDTNVWSGNSLKSFETFANFYKRNDSTFSYCSSLWKYFTVPVFKIITVVTKLFHTPFRFKEFFPFFVSFQNFFLKHTNEETNQEIVSLLRIFVSFRETVSDLSIPWFE